MDLFMAVVFLCLGNECTFLQSPEPYRSFSACMQAAANEVKDLKKNNPGIALIDGACIKVSMKGA